VPKLCPTTLAEECAERCLGGRRGRTGRHVTGQPQRRFLPIRWLCLGTLQCVGVVFTVDAAAAGEGIALKLSGLWSLPSDHGGEP
jgi:hypothetical protein